MIFSVKGLGCGYGRRTVLSGVNFELSEGEILCLLGPNGVGKTTLFKTILGLLAAKQGRITLDGEDVTRMSPAKLAKNIAYVPQTNAIPYPFRVIDVVVMGRLAYLGLFGAPSKQDYCMAEQALDKLGILFLRDRIYTKISGGERQLIMIAKALVQAPRLIVMDEPTSNLDLGNQMKVLGEVKKLKDEGLSIIMTTHFPNHAFLCSSQVFLINRNGDCLSGDCDNIITEDNISSTYGIGSRITSVEGPGGAVFKTCVAFPVQKIPGAAPAG